MGHKKIAIGALVILLVTGVTGVATSAPNVSSAHSIVPAGPPGLPASACLHVQAFGERGLPYVAGTYSHGVQGLAQAVPGWQQVNSNGFGDPLELEVSALEAFNGYLYAGTHNVVDPAPIFDGARIFRSQDGVMWTPITQPGFSNPHDSAAPAILDFVVFGNRIYASTGRGGNPAQIWRASNGVSWAPMVSSGFGDPDIHDIAALAVYNGMIYAGASSQVNGARIFRSLSGDSNTWNPVASAASTMPGAGITGFAVFNGALWATVESEAPVQIWRSSGGAWTVVSSNGFGNSNTNKTGGMAVFAGYLYVGAGNTVEGAQLWRTNDGTGWAQAISPGFGDSNNQKVEMVFVFQNQLYVSVKNGVTGIELWRSADGTVWEQSNQDGFGDSNNSGTNRSNATADFQSHLYVGTSNVVDGGELWRMLQPEQSISGLSAVNNSPTALGSMTTLTASVATGTNVTYAWQLGDGALATGAVVTHTYGAVGSYTAIVTASNSVNTLTATTHITITDAPIVGLAVSNDSPTLLGNPTELSASVATGSNVVYEWSLGDSGLGNGRVVSHTYPHAGLFTATVTAANSASGPLTKTTVVEIVTTEQPIEGLGAANDSPTPLGGMTTLTASVTSGSSVAFAWNLGDGQVRAGRVITYRYARFGAFTAIVTATNSLGQMSATTAVIITAPNHTFLPLVLRSLSFP